MNLTLNQADVIGKIKQFNYMDLIIFLIPFIIFTIYLYIFNPSIMSFDSLNQLHQIATGEFGNTHPFFHTFIEMLCLKVYPTPASYCVFQISVFSIMWMCICKYFRKTKKHFILQLIITLAISLIPINALFSITLWKDVLFSYFLMFTCFLIKVLFDKDDVSIGFIILISVVMAFTAQLRHNGTIVILIFLVALALYLYKKNKSQKLYIAIPALTIVFILLIASLNVVYDVEDTQKDALYTKVIHMLSDYDLYLDLSNDDRAKIHNVISEKDIKEYYNPTFSDPVYGHGNHSAYSNNKMDYITMAIKYSILNPLHFVKYLFYSSPIVWDITRDSDWIGNVYYTTGGEAKKPFYDFKKTTPAAGYDDPITVNSQKGFYKEFNAFVLSLRNNYIFQTLFLNPALCMYLSIIMMIAIHLITKSKSIYIVYLPNLLNIVVVFLSTPIQDVRYLYPNFLVCYLLIIILLSCIQKLDNSMI